MNDANGNPADSSTSALWQGLVAICNRCGSRGNVYRVREEGRTLAVAYLPCPECSYRLNLVIAVADEDVAHCGADTEALRHLESLNPGPMNLTHKALELLSVEADGLMVRLRG